MFQRDTQVDPLGRPLPYPPGPLQRLARSLKRLDEKAKVAVAAGERVFETLP